MNFKKLHGNAFENTRVLVTGGGGFIGSHVVEALVQLGAQVVTIDNLVHGSWDNLVGFGDNVTKITASIADADAMAKAVDGCRYVFHLAGLGSVPRSLVKPQLYIEANMIGTYTLLEAARHANVHRVIFSGSSNYYGSWGDTNKPRVETQPPMPLNPYAATKLFCEGAMRSWAYSFGLDTCVLRYFNIFGPRQNPNSDYAAVLVAFAKALHQGKPATIYGDGEQSRDFTYVANAVHANLLAAAHPEPLMGEVFNAAAGHRYSVNYLYQKIAEMFDKANLEPIHAEARKGEVRHSQADITKACDVLGYEPLVDFETGLAETVRWYKHYLSEASV